MASNSKQPLVIGVNGAQGTGKSTLSLVLEQSLKHDHQLHSAIISIDDIYLTRRERDILAKQIHPLLKTRGVPGTHDVSMGINLIQQLKNQHPTQLPTFNKAIDDRTKENQWIQHHTPVDVIIFEGWCVGAQPQSTKDIVEPCNSLEQSEDPDAIWRNFANQQLAGPYKELFELIDFLVMLKAPNFECVYNWRSTQENKLRDKSSDQQNHSIMNDQQIKKFIMHYERITHWMLSEMPQRADCLLELNPDHNITKSSYLNAND